MPARRRFEHSTQPSVYRQVNIPDPFAFQPQQKSDRRRRHPGPARPPGQGDSAPRPLAGCMHEIAPDRRVDGGGADGVGPQPVARSRFVCVPVKTITAAFGQKPRPHRRAAPPRRRR